MIKTTRDVITHTSKYIRGRTLDLGAGNAKYRGIIKPLCSEYVTYDMVPGPNINIVGDILNLDLPDNSFDTVISTQVLEHVSKPWVMIGQINRILTDQGICILSAPFLIPFHADPHDYFRYTKEGMTSLFKDQGFEIIECSSYGKTFSVLSEFIHFSLFNPYQQNKNKYWHWLMPKIEKLLVFLDRFSKSTIIYPNVFIVAKKLSHD